MCCHEMMMLSQHFLACFRSFCFCAQTEQNTEHRELTEPFQFRRTLHAELPLSGTKTGVQIKLRALKKVLT